MQITAQMVGQLREQTGAGMMECKKALAEADGDIARARDILRARGKAGAEKRAARAAADGVVAAALTPSGGALVELNSETDFVARNEEFRQLAADLASAAADSDAASPEDLLQKPLTGGQTGQHRLEDVLARLRENIVFKRFVRYEQTPGAVIGSYIHTVTRKTGVLIELEGDAANPDHVALARNIAMHIAATKPQYVRRDEVPAEVVEREKEVLAEKTRNEGKPEAAIAKIVEGRIGKFFEDVCLDDQGYVRDEKVKVGDMVKAAGAQVRRFALFQVGQ